MKKDVKKTVLITGGSGLIGKRLSTVLAQRGYAVRWLTRTPDRPCRYKCYGWDVEAMRVDSQAFDRLDYLIHLAGAPIADEAWTPVRKKRIRDSRVKGAELLYQGIEQSGCQPEVFVSASGIHYYGSSQGDQVFSEEAPAGKGFLSEVCAAWEGATQGIADRGIRSVQLRTPTVLSLSGGALPQIARPFKRNLGAALGSGQQPFSWIHLDDLVALYQYALERELEGPYNAVAPNQVKNESFSKALAKVMQKRFFMPKVPGFALKLWLGARSELLLKGVWASPEKLLNTDFRFAYPSLESALEHLFLKRYSLRGRG